jgi:GNAT superfamily N-acetyltransferase
MKVQFRVCTAADLPIVQNDALSLYSEDLPGTEMTPEKIQNTFRELTQKPDKGQIIVFEIAQTVVGYAILIFFWSNEFGGNFVEIDELFVQKNYRNQGIAKTFFQWLEATWRGQAVALSLQTTPTNDRAIAVYHRLGFAISQNVYLLKMMPSAQDTDTH